MGMTLLKESPQIGGLQAIMQKMNEQKKIINIIGTGPGSAFAAHYLAKKKIL